MVVSAAPRALILGITGQDGAYLSDLLLSKGYEVHGATRDAKGQKLRGLARLGISEKVILHTACLTDAAAAYTLVSTVEPDEVYILMGQSSVGTSFALPAETFRSIALATLNVLESLRVRARPVRIFNAASTDCYGHTAKPADEQTPFNPMSPYGAAKVAAFEIARSYRKSLGLFVASGILSNHESPLRPEQFVTTKIVKAVVAIAGGSRERLRLGSLSVCRDWGWAPDYVEAFWRMLQQETPSDFVIATGQTNALETFVAEAFAAADLDWKDHVDFDTMLLRDSEFSTTNVSPAKAAKELGWQAKHRMRDVVRLLIASHRGMVEEALPWRL